MWEKTFQGLKSFFVLFISCRSCSAFLASRLAESMLRVVVASRSLVTSLRRLMAVGDAVLRRGHEHTALDLWLCVVQEENFRDMTDPGTRVLWFFLLAQTQSAHCERAFAKVCEMQFLGMIQKKSFCALKSFVPLPWKPRRKKHFLWCGSGEVASWVQVLACESGVKKVFVKRQGCWQDHVWRWKGMRLARPRRCVQVSKGRIHEKGCVVEKRVRAARKELNKLRTMRVPGRRARSGCRIPDSG